ncbi:T9SS type A sorting domain-containing protein [bacterium]|nr:T9SS type A sorting domain-containing protein [bacterium]
MRRIAIILWVLFSFAELKAQVWTPLNGGVSGVPTATTQEGQLLAVASIVENGNGYRSHRIQIWNGYYWQKLPLLVADSSSFISSLQFYKKSLYIAGRFDSIKGISSAQNIIRWKDRAYEAVTAFNNNIDNFAAINQLSTYKGLLVAAGPFKVKSSLDGDNLAFFNGISIVSPSTILSFGSGVNGSISAIYSDDTATLIVGGRFTLVNDTSTAQLAYYRNGKWNRITNNDKVASKITLKDSTIYFMGRSLASKELGIYKSTGNSTDTAENGIENILALFDLININGNIYASGIFEMDGINSNVNLIHLDGDTWKAVKNGSITGLRNLEEYNGALIGSGPFVYHNLQKFNYIAEYTENVGLVSGKVYFDKDKNCKFSDRDEALQDFVIQIQPGNHIIKPGVEGNFFAFLEEGKYTLIIHPGKYWFPSDCSNDSIEIELKKGELLANRDFALIQKTGIRDLSVRLTSSSGLRVNKDRNIAYTLTFENRGSEDVASTSVSLTSDSRLNNVKFDPSPSSVNGNNATWEINDFYAGERRNIHCVFAYADNSTDDIELSASIPIEGNDVNPEDNQSELSQELSEFEYEFHKSILGDQLGDSIELIDSATEIEYIINFANYTSDTIYTVYVVDTIKLNHSLSYIQTTAASHDFQTEAFPGKKGEDIGIIIWTFEDIKLAPNPNQNPEIVSHQGFVRFKLGLNPNLAQGMTLTNRASVVFDYYDAQSTNTTQAVVVNQIAGIEEFDVENALFKVYPNPAGNTIHLDIELNGFQNYSYSIYGMDGQICLSGEQSSDALDIENLSAGVYFIKVYSQGEIYTCKFVKL